MKQTGYAFLAVLFAVPAFAAEPATTSAPVARIITNTDPDFTMQLPAGFQDSKSPSSPMYIWEQLDSQNLKTNVYIVIDRMQELSQTPFEKPPNVDRMYTQKWQGWDITVYRVRTKIKNELNEEQVMVTRNAAVPLAGHAVKLQVTGPEAMDAQLDAMMKNLLAGLKGQTNWTTPEKRQSHVLWWAIGLVVATALTAAVLVLRKRQWKNRRQQSAGAAMHMPK
jgi:hypothetical protein